MGDGTKPTPSTRRPTQYQLAAGVARHVELRNVLLRSISSALRVPVTDASAVIESGKTAASVKFTPTYSFDDASLALSVAIDFEISVSNEDSADSAELLAFAATFELLYGLDSAPPVEHRDLLLSAFAQMNATYNAWPYLRELLQSTTARMNLPPVVLPVFRVSPDTDSTSGRPELEADKRDPAPGDQQ